MSIKLIGIDLDGTLLNAEGRVSDANLDACRRARDAGCLVVPCTGRGYRESEPVLEQLGFPTPGVFNTGALVVDHPSGQTLVAHPLEPGLVHELIELLRYEQEAVLVYRDFNAVGHDYLVTGHGEVTVNSHWWFNAMRLRVAEDRQPTLDALEHALRVGVVGPEPRITPMTQRVLAAFPGRVEAHSFNAIQDPDPEMTVSILEVFAADVTKWRGLQWLAQQHGIAESDVAFLGDEINDVPALQAAGVGVAMANAVPQAKAVADVVLEQTNDQDGVAIALDEFSRSA